MSNTMAFPTKRDAVSNRAQMIFDLPEPRIWKPKHLAEFLGVSVHWVYKRTEAAAEDPIPRIPGVGRLSFDTYSAAFQKWIGRQLGCVDIGDSDA